MTAPPIDQVIDAEIRDFSRPHIPIRFRIDDDVFSGPATLSARRLVEFGESFDRLDEPGIKPQLDALTELIRIFLYPDSFELLNRRLGDDDNPISYRQLDLAVDYLMEQHGLRPTLPSSDSSSPSSSPASGTGSTAPVPPVDSTPSISPSPDS